MLNNKKLNSANDARFQPDLGFNNVLLKIKNNTNIENSNV